MDKVKILVNVISARQGCMVRCEYRPPIEAGYGRPSEAEKFRLILDFPEELVIHIDPADIAAWYGVIGQAIKDQDAYLDERGGAAVPARSVMEDPAFEAKL